MRGPFNVIFDRQNFKGENNEPSQPKEALSFEAMLCRAGMKVAQSWISDRESATNFSASSLFARAGDEQMEDAYADI